MGSLVSPVSILGPLPQISEHTPINSLALVNIIFVKLMCWWWFHMESIKVGINLKDLSCSFSRSPLQGLCRSRAQTGIIFMKNLPNSKRHTSQTVAASKAEAKLRLDYYGIGQNPIAELDLDRFTWSTWDIWHFHRSMIFISDLSTNIWFNFNSQPLFNLYSCNDSEHRTYLCEGVQSDAQIYLKSSWQKYKYNQCKYNIIE